MNAIEPEVVYEHMEQVLTTEAAAVEKASKSAAGHPKKPVMTKNPHSANSPHHESHVADYHTQVAKHYSAIAKKNWEA